jgi:hypothetical protein
MSVGVCEPVHGMCVYTRWVSLEFVHTGQLRALIVVVVAGPIVGKALLVIICAPVIIKETLLRSFGHQSEQRINQRPLLHIYYLWARHSP